MTERQVKELIELLGMFRDVRGEGGRFELSAQQQSLVSQVNAWATWYRKKQWGEKYESVDGLGIA